MDVVSLIKEGGRLEYRKACLSRRLLQAEENGEDLFFMLQEKEELARAMRNNQKRANDMGISRAHYALGKQKATEEAAKEAEEEEMHRQVEQTRLNITENVQSSVMLKKKMDSHLCTMEKTMEVYQGQQEQFRREREAWKEEMQVRKEEDRRRREEDQRQFKELLQMWKQDGREIERLKRENERLKQDNEKIKEERERIREDNERVREDNERLREGSDRLREESDQLREERDRLREERDRLREERDRLREDNQDFTGQRGQELEGRGVENEDARTGVLAIEDDMAHFNFDDVDGEEAAGGRYEPAAEATGGRGRRAARGRDGPAAEATGGRDGPAAEATGGRDGPAAEATGGRGRGATRLATLRAANREARRGFHVSKRVLPQLAPTFLSNDDKL